MLFNIFHQNKGTINVESLTGEEYLNNYGISTQTSCLALADHSVVAVIKLVIQLAIRLTLNDTLIPGRFILKLFVIHSVIISKKLLKLV